jgi:imipenem/basic amino acid-specific outer membrane pore
MKRMLHLSLLASIMAVNAMAADDLAGMFKEGKASGQIRMFWVDREYQGTAGNKTHRDATAIGGYLKYETGDLKGLSLGTAFYTTNGLFLESPRDDYTQNDMTLLGPDNENYSMVGELYAQYKRGNTTFKGGRQKLDTPMAGSDDARMTPNLFEAYLLVNKDVPNTTIVAGHVTKFAQGSFGRVYDHTEANTGPKQILSVTSGYSLINSLDQVGEFVNMGTYTLGKSTNGVSVLSATYTGIDNLKLQLWDYYAHDIANIIYGEANLNWKCALSSSIKPSAGIQIIKQDDVGDSYAGAIDSLYVAGKVGFQIDNFDLGFAYSETTKNSASDIVGSGNVGQANAIITPWGGIPAYTQGMVTRHMFLAGTKAFKVNGGYNFKDLGANLVTSAYYTEFDMDKNSGYGLERTASEAGFDAIYYPETVKNLQLRFRGNFPRNFYEASPGTTGWSEYRFIANYNF